MTIPRMLRDVDGNIIPQVWNGVDWIPYEGQVKNLDTLAQEATLAATRSTLDALSGKAATETKLEAVRTLLATLGSKDFATQTTLAAMQTELALVKAELEAIKAQQIDGTQKVTLSGNIAKWTAETVINAQSVAAGGDTGWQTIDTQGAVTLLAIAIDQQPWSLSGRGGPWNPSLGNTPVPFFPRLVNITRTFSSVDPAQTLMLINSSSEQSELQPATIHDAMHRRLVGTNQVRIGNGSANTATVTLRVLRIWR